MVSNHFVTSERKITKSQKTLALWELNFTVLYHRTLSISTAGHLWHPYHFLQMQIMASSLRSSPNLNTKSSCQVGREKNYLILLGQPHADQHHSVCRTPYHTSLETQNKDTHDQPIFTSSLWPWLLITSLKSHTLNSIDNFCRLNDF